MKKTFRIIAILLVVVMTLGCLVSCGKTECEKNGHKYGEDGVCSVCGEKDPSFVEQSECEKNGHKFNE